MSPCQCGPESNCNEEVIHIPQTSRQVPHHEMQFSLIPRTRFQIQLSNTKNSIHLHTDIFKYCNLITIDEAGKRLGGGWGQPPEVQARA